MSYVNSTAASPEPSAFCGVYSNLNFAKLSDDVLGEAVFAAAAAGTDTEVISTSFIVILMYSSGLSPALRTVSIAS